MINDYWRQLLWLFDNPHRVTDGYEARKSEMQYFIIKHSCVFFCARHRGVDVMDDKVGTALTLSMCWSTTLAKAAVQYLAIAQLSL